MKRIKILHTFRDGQEQFLATEERLVSPEKAGYFCGQGWAQDITPNGERLETGARDTSPKKLEVRSVRQVNKPRNVGDQNHG